MCIRDSVGSEMCIRDSIGISPVILLFALGLILLIWVNPKGEQI
jgi:hypothetical protein